MILKVRSMLKDGNGWLILGDIKAISLSDGLCEMTYGELLDLGEVGDYLVFDNPFVESTDVPSFDPNAQILSCKRIMVTTESKERVDIWFNDVGYLMNDEGKTVETIYGY